MRASGAKQHKHTTNRNALVDICGGTGYNSTTNVGPTLMNASCKQNTIARRVMFLFPEITTIRNQSLEPNIVMKGFVVLGGLTLLEAQQTNNIHI